MSGSQQPSSQSPPPQEDAVPVQQGPSSQADLLDIKVPPQLEEPVIVPLEDEMPAQSYVQSHAPQSYPSPDLQAQYLPYGQYPVSAVQPGYPAPNIQAQYQPGYPPQYYQPGYPPQYQPQVVPMMNPYANAMPMPFPVQSMAFNSVKNSGVQFHRSLEFKDDEEITIKVVEERKDAVVTEDKLQVSAKCSLSPVQLTLAPQEVPCMVSLRGVSKDLEEIERARPGLDLVCVIDISGSMGGNKIALVRQTLDFLVTKLTTSDRLSLVAFDDSAFRVCPLLAATSAGKATMEGYIKRLAGEGGTNLVEGLECGLHVLAHRRIVNTVTSLFLLSDGVDNDVSTALARSQEVLNRYRPQIHGDFTVHTFGYGEDHDSNVMCNIADQGAGAFHFVEKLESIAEAFADSFGGLVSQVAKNVGVRLQVVPAPVPCRITKVYTKSGEDFFSLPAVMANESKDFVFILEVGAGELLGEQTCPVVVAEVRYSSVTGQAISERVELAITFAPTGAQVDLNVREDVLVNFYRVKGAEILKEASTLAEAGQYARSRECLDAGVRELQSSLVASHALVATLIRDLQDAKNRVRDDSAWRMGGAAQVKSVFSNHYAQSASSNAQYYMQPQQMAYNMQFQAYQQSKQP